MEKEGEEMKKKIKNMFLIMILFITLLSCQGKKKDYSKMSSEEIMKEATELNLLVEKENNVQKKLKLERKRDTLVALAMDKSTVEVKVVKAPEKVKVIYKTAEQISKMTEEELDQEREMLRSKLWYETEITEKDEQYSELLRQRYIKIYNDRKNKN